MLSVRTKRHTRDAFLNGTATIVPQGLTVRIAASEANDFSDLVQLRITDRDFYRRLINRPVSYAAETQLELCVTFRLRPGDRFEALERNIRAEIAHLNTALADKRQSQVAAE